MASNREFVAELTVHPDSELSLGTDMQKTSSNTPTSLTTTVYSITDTASTDVTATLGTPTATASGTIAFTGTISGWSDGTKYQVELKFTLDGNVLVSYWIVDCTDNRPPAA